MFIKQIPNLFTLLNLLCGCLAIVVTIQTGLTVSTDTTGQQIIEIPKQVYWASIYIGAAAVIDFFDGFVARLLKVSSEMGKQLDSLADVVSFGVAPGMILYEFLQRSYAGQENGLEVNTMLLLPAFIIPCAGAYRLARFNISHANSKNFQGLPIPAAGLLIASLPLMYWFSTNAWVIELIINKWFLYAFIFIISYLMISTLPMLALKFTKVSIKVLLPFIIIAIITIITAFTFGWLSVPVAFVSYVFISLIFKQAN